MARSGRGISDEPSGQFGEVEPDEFPEGKVPEEDYYNVPPIIPGTASEPSMDRWVLRGSLVPGLHSLTFSLLSGCIR